MSTLFGEENQINPLSLEDLEFDLPPGLIAQSPPESREDARLLVYDRGTEKIQHREIRDLGALIPPSSLLVFNNTQVLRARLRSRRATGARVELLITSWRPPNRFLAMTRPARRIKVGERLEIAPGSAIVALEHKGDGEIEFTHEGTQDELLAHGKMPLPPYIRRKSEGDPRDRLDLERYQTVFAAEPGAIAAPTAGLHFTDSLLQGLCASGHELAYVTLHVGAGTFAPIRVNDLEQHTMHKESFSVQAGAAEQLNGARAQGRSIISVGTTSLRTLETIFQGGLYREGSGDTDLFIRPPHQVKSAHGLLTNFHLPGSTLLALVASMVGSEQLFSLYRIAIEERYRFFSYGDAMLIL